MAAAVELGGAGAMDLPPPPDAAPAPARAGPLPPLILVTTVDIGDGMSDKIEVRQGEDPLHLAAAFVAKHGLPEGITEALAQHLADNLREAAAQAAGGGGDERWSAGGSSQTANPLHSTGADSGGHVSAYSDGTVAFIGEEDSQVFERLYHQAVVLREKLEQKRMQRAMEEEMAINSGRAHMTWVSQEMMRDRTAAGRYGNYGEMLYAESKEGAARRRAKAERERAEREAEELAAATFTPEISRMALAMKGRADNSGPPQAWQRLSKGSLSKTAERMEALRRERAEAEARECTFRPAINARSDKLMAGRNDTLRSLNVSAHHQLYQDSVRRQQKQEAYANWFPEDATFQPKLIASKRPGGAGAGAGSASPGRAGAEAQQPLADRLYASYEKLQAKLAEARARLEGPVDPATGRPLYHPQTGRGPAFARHAPGQGVGEYLYAKQQEKEDKMRAKLEEEARRTEEARRAKLHASTLAIVRRLHTKRFQQVFEFLDRDGRGFVDMAALVEAPPYYLDDLDDDVRDDLESAARLACRGAAIASEGQEAAATPIDPTKVALDAFVGLMEEAIAAAPRPRVYLARSAQPRYPEPEPFAPTIDERSRAMAAKLRPKDMPVHELLHREATSLSARRAALRANVVDAAMRECTFAPRLVSEQIVPQGRVMQTMRSSMRRGNTSSLGPEDCAALDALAEAEAEAQAAVRLGNPDEGADGSEARARDLERANEEGQFLELEAEVEAMLEATNAAAAAAERLAAPGRGGGAAAGSEQRYLSKLLVMTQEAVNALEQLPGWEARASRGGTAGPSAAAGPSSGADEDADADASLHEAPRLLPRGEPLLSPAVAGGAGPAAKSLFSVTRKGPGAVAAQ